MKGRKPYRNLNVDTISKIIELSQKGYGSKAISRELNISKETAYIYIKDFCD